ncbi:MAG: alpha/beta hydrolase [Oscillospiraceae bacterium]|nr:alpha/beta hydrolase [Oscillospiraceae bacterium]
MPDRDAIPVGFGTSARFFDGPGEDTALIFYPGAKVEAAAYAPLLAKIAAGGTDCFLVEMPLHFAFFGVNAADPIIETNSYAHWVLAGHSLGGVAASNYARTHTDTVAGLVLLASYPTDETGSMPFLSIYGDRDGVLNRESYEKSRVFWPEDAEELVIPGGNHAQFGDYGPQRGDGEAAITQDEQQTQTAQAILYWIQTQISKGVKAA